MKSPPEVKERDIGSKGVFHSSLSCIFLLSMCTDPSSSWPRWIQPTLLLCSLVYYKVLTRGGGQEVIACTPLFLMWGALFTPHPSLLIPHSSHSSLLIPHSSHPLSLTHHIPHPSLLTSLTPHPSLITSLVPHSSHPSSLTPHIPHSSHPHSSHPSLLLTIQIILFKLIGLLFPTSDYQHSVVTPAMLFMGQLLLKVAERCCMLLVSELILMSVYCFIS